MKKILYGALLLIAAYAGLLMFSAIVDEFPRWVDKAVILALLGFAIFCNTAYMKQSTRIDELEEQLGRRKEAPKNR